jgi:hypothetical protein
MISDQRRREILREMKEGAKEFAEAWRLAAAYRKAGNIKMAKYFMNSVKVKRRKRTPEETAWILELAEESFHRIARKEAERREQGLPPSEYKLPSFH